MTGRRFTGDIPFGDIDMHCSDGFVVRAPVAVVAAERAKLERLRDEPEALPVPSLAGP